jgi:hypothetical protein
MGIREEQKNKKLACKYNSHTANLLKSKFPSEEFSKEAEKTKRAARRFSNFIRKSTQKQKIFQN